MKRQFLVVAAAAWLAAGPVFAQVVAPVAPATALAAPAALAAAVGATPLAAPASLASIILPSAVIPQAPSPISPGFALTPALSRAGGAGEGERQGGGKGSIASSL